MYRASLLALVTYLSVLPPAQAQVQGAFARVLRNPQEQAMVVATAKRSNVVIEDSCKHPFIKLGNRVRIEATPQFDGGGKLISGRWEQSVFYAGCGIVRILNVLISVEPGLRPMTRALLPGTTHAGPDLQLDVFRAPALKQMIDHWRDPKCAKVYVNDTAFIDQESTAAPGSYGPRWREAWTVAACGRKQVILVVFTPDRSGATFTILANSEDQDKRGASL